MVQDEPDRLKSGYKRVVKNTMLVNTILLFGLIACARPMVEVLLGDKWLGCVPFLQILCISHLLHPLHSINLNALAVKGRSDLCLRLEIIKKCISVIPICIGIFIDIYTMLISSTFIGLLAYYVNAYYAKPLLNYGIKEQIQDIMPSILIGGIMCLLILPIKLLPVHNAVQLAIQIVLGGIISISLCRMFKLREYFEILEIFTPTLRKFKLKK
jgi:O-antigen/teichoic acid export membrane protein